MTEKIVTEPFNAYLIECFRAFQAEGLPPAMAAAMVQAHMAHGQAGALNRLAEAMEKIADLHTDPINLNRFNAMLAAQDAKRHETQTRRETAESREALGEMLKEATL
jgi:hypothetical protein